MKRNGRSSACSSGHHDRCSGHRRVGDRNKKKRCLCACHSKDVEKRDPPLRRSDELAAISGGPHTKPDALQELGQAVGMISDAGAIVRGARQIIEEHPEAFADEPEVLRVIMDPKLDPYARLGLPGAKPYLKAAIERTRQSPEWKEAVKLMEANPEEARKVLARMAEELMENAKKLDLATRPQPVLRLGYRDAAEVLDPPEEERPSCFGSCYEGASACDGCGCYNSCRRRSK